MAGAGGSWVSEPGNLYATLLLGDPAPPAVVPGICFVAALAVHDAILDTTQGLAPAQLQLKWPNDLLLIGKKLGGILVEGSTRADGRTTAVVGFGRKLHAPSRTCRISRNGSRSRTAIAVSAESLFAALGATHGGCV
jgi:BirA family transcriptional regulator, biotin operon repressor / biotin---[acetyl-CoA-carboxylase] ligase